MKGFKCGSNVGMFRGAGDSAGKCILNLSKVFNLCDRKSVVKRITIVKKRLNEGSGDSGGSGKVKSVTDANDVTNVLMAILEREEICIEKDKLRVEDKSEIPTWGSGRNGLRGREGK